MVPTTALPPSMSSLHAAARLASWPPMPPEVRAVEEIDDAVLAGEHHLPVGEQGGCHRHVEVAGIVLRPVGRREVLQELQRRGELERRIAVVVGLAGRMDRAVAGADPDVAVAIDGGSGPTHPDRALAVAGGGVHGEERRSPARLVDRDDPPPVRGAVPVVPTHAEHHLAARRASVRCVGAAPRDPHPGDPRPGSSRWRPTSSRQAHQHVRRAAVHQLVGHHEDLAPRRVDDRRAGDAHGGRDVAAGERRTTGRGWPDAATRPPPRSRRTARTPCRPRSPHRRPRRHERLPVELPVERGRGPRRGRCATADTGSVRRIRRRRRGTPSTRPGSTDVDAAVRAPAGCAAQSQGVTTRARAASPAPLVHTEDPPPCMWGHANNRADEGGALPGHPPGGWSPPPTRRTYPLWWVNGLRQRSEHVRCASAVWPARRLARPRTRHPTKKELPCPLMRRPAVQGGRPLRGRVRPQGDRPGRARDARPHGHAIRVRREPAAGRRPHHRIAAHDGADRRAHRDPDRPRGPGALGQLQHLLDPGPRRGGRGGRARRHRRRSPRASPSSPGRARRSRSTGGAPSRRCCGRARAGRT